MPGSMLTNLPAPQAGQGTGILGGGAPSPGPVGFGPVEGMRPGAPMPAAAPAASPNPGIAAQVAAGAALRGGLHPAGPGAFNPTGFDHFHVDNR